MALENTYVQLRSYTLLMQVMVLRAYHVLHSVESILPHGCASNIKHREAERSASGRPAGKWKERTQPYCLTPEVNLSITDAEIVLVIPCGHKIMVLSSELRRLFS